MAVPANNDAFDEADVLVGAGSAEGDVLIKRNQGVGWVEIDPSEAGEEDGDPCMGGVDTDQAPCRAVGG